jgi:hypothetical protein
MTISRNFKNLNYVLDSASYGVVKNHSKNKTKIRRFRTCQRCMRLMTHIFLLVSSLNGNNGEATNCDDVDYIACQESATCPKTTHFHYKRPLDKAGKKGEKISGALLRKKRKQQNVVCASKVELCTRENCTDDHYHEEGNMSRKEIAYACAQDLLLGEEVMNDVISEQESEERERQSPRIYERLKTEMTSKIINDKEENDHVRKTKNMAQSGNISTKNKSIPSFHENRDDYFRRMEKENLDKIALYEQPRAVTLTREQRELSAMGFKLDPEYEELLRLEQHKMIELTEKEKSLGMMRKIISKRKETNDRVEKKDTPQYDQQVDSKSTAEARKPGNENGKDSISHQVCIDGEKTPQSGEPEKNSGFSCDGQISDVQHHIPGVAEGEITDRKSDDSLLSVISEFEAQENENEQKTTSKIHNFASLTNRMYHALATDEADVNDSDSEGSRVVAEEKGDVGDVSSISCESDSLDTLSETENITLIEDKRKARNAMFKGCFEKLERTDRARVDVPKKIVVWISMSRATNGKIESSIFRTILRGLLTTYRDFFYTRSNEVPFDDSVFRLHGHKRKVHTSFSAVYKPKFFTSLLNGASFAREEIGSMDIIGDQYDASTEVVGFAKLLDWLMMQSGTIMMGSFDGTVATWIGARFMHLIFDYDPLYFNSQNHERTLNTLGFVLNSVYLKQQFAALCMPPASMGTMMHNFNEQAGKSRKLHFQLEPSMYHSR